MLHFHGPQGSGKRTLAAALCRKLGFPLLVVDMAELLRRFAEPEDAIQRIFRYALLLQSPVYFDQIELLTAEDGRNRSHLQTFRRQAEAMSWLAFLGTESAWSGDGFDGRTFISVEMPAPDVTVRKELWQEIAAGARIGGDVDWDDLAVKFRLTPGRMKKALETASARASLREETEAAISRADLYTGCYSQSNQKLSTLAQRIVPRHHWNDIILPANATEQLREICIQLKHRRQVYEGWGFNEKLSRGRGLCALFYGQSGVGKTMAAEVLAHELFLEIYKIDLSTVVSKYIGETEKNLSKIFREAEDSNAVLFFDEADALFGKRSEVKDAHDRYANIEINYLLQRMEEFDGLVVLATNLRRNIDEGFFRRMHFAVEFPFPDQSHRYRIWKQHFPEKLPVAGDVDLDYLARRFTLSGGNIKNVVLAAAFLAAENSGQIHMSHLIRATRREYEKIGRLCTENEFAPYQWALSCDNTEQPVEAGNA
ncbi:MAG TPA: ATP-binding protein [Candidatus Sulfotelmatobacter sp.]|nr:ATP-binding protein [Candidatus Sulfotelmatobacter sp.]